MQWKNSIQIYWKKKGFNWHCQIYHLEKQFLERLVNLIFFSNLQKVLSFLTQLYDRIPPPSFLLSSIIIHIPHHKTPEPNKIWFWIKRCRGKPQIRSRIKYMNLVATLQSVRLSYESPLTTFTMADILKTPHKKYFTCVRLWNQRESETWWDSGIRSGQEERASIKRTGYYCTYSRFKISSPKWILKAFSGFSFVFYVLMCVEFK